MHRPLSRFAALSVLALAAALPPADARAEKADRFKQVNVESELPGQFDVLKQLLVFNGNVVVTKGTMAIRAARIEVSETPDGYYMAKAFGSPGQHAVFRQKRDAPDEWIEGDAERLEYDGKSDIIRFITNATVKRLRGSASADEITGNLVTYDSTTEIFNVSGGAAPTVANPGGRVRAILMPREGTPAAAEAASAAASAAAAAGSAPPLRTTPARGVVK